MELIFENDFRLIPKEDKISYVKNVLGSHDGIIYGKVIRVYKENALFIKPYNLHGIETNIYLDKNQGWGIYSSKKSDINMNDYVRGRLCLSDKEELNLTNIEKLDSEEDFREKLLRRLISRYKEDGIEFNKSDFIAFDNTILFSDWIAEKVEVLIEEKYNERIYEKKKKIKSLEKDFSDINSELYNAKKRLSDIEKKISEISSKYKHFKELGIIKDRITDITNMTEYSEIKYPEIIKNVWGCLWKEKDLYYPKHIINAFMNSLRTKQLILLWGKPGTGKTSLVKNVANIIGAKFVRIQVQSNWTDNQDLIGFYNVIDKRYVSTQFLDAIIEASNNPKQLYLILLDEMNLSNIEYYFSEMLNVFTWDEEYNVHLYSERVKILSEEELEQVEQKGGDISILKQQCEDMNYYRPIIKIPLNIRFIGTLNSDSTTKRISPKVIDRSYLIELQTMTEYEKTNEEGNLPKRLKLGKKDMYINSEVFAVEKSTLKEAQELLGRINRIRNVGVPISNRLDMYIQQWIGHKDNTIELDEIILGRILPLLDFEYSSEKNKMMVERLKNELVTCEMSLGKLQRMEERAKDVEYLTYWED